MMFTCPCMSNEFGSLWYPAVRRTPSMPAPNLGRQVLGRYGRIPGDRFELPAPSQEAAEGANYGRLRARATPVFPQVPDVIAGKSGVFVRRNQEFPNIFCSKKMFSMSKNHTRSRGWRSPCAQRLRLVRVRNTRTDDFMMLRSGCPAAFHWYCS